MAIMTVRRERWPLNEPFIISRAVQEEGEVVVVEIEQDGIVGRGECEECDVFFQGRDQVVGDIEAQRAAIEAGIGREELQRLIGRGPARNAIDCALWDLQAKTTATPVWKLAGLAGPLQPVTTVFTISLGSPEKMAADARANAHRPVLKLKLGRDGDPERVAAVRHAAPDARLSVDANTGWSEAQLFAYLPQLAELGVELVEQPFLPGADDCLKGFTSPIPLAADESCLDRASLPGLVGKYAYVNVKLDKTGGLSEAMNMARAAQALGFGVMVGCNVGTSLAMAPAMVVAQLADFVDLDGPLLLARDRVPGLVYDNATVHPPQDALWGKT